MHLHIICSIHWDYGGLGRFPFKIYTYSLLSGDTVPYAPHGGVRCALFSRELRTSKRHHHRAEVITAIFLKDTLDAASNDAEHLVVETWQM